MVVFHLRFRFHLYYTSDVAAQSQTGVKLNRVFFPRLALQAARSFEHRSSTRGARASCEMMQTEERIASTPPPAPGFCHRRRPRGASGGAFRTGRRGRQRSSTTTTHGRTDAEAEEAISSTKKQEKSTTATTCTVFEPPISVSNDVALSFSHKISQSVATI